MDVLRAEGILFSERHASQKRRDRNGHSASPCGVCSQSITLFHPSALCLGTCKDGVHGPWNTLGVIRVKPRVSVPRNPGCATRGAGPEAGLDADDFEDRLISTNEDADSACPIAVFRFSSNTVISMALPDSISRRSLLKTSAGVAAGLTAFGLPTGKVLGANETLNVACIGTGGRCRFLMKSLATIPNVRIAAVCDVYDVHLDLARKLADPKALATKSYKELLDRKDIDAVLIGTPDHWHVPMTVDACAAGKDVYVEKPLTHNLSEGKAVIEAQNKHKRIVQVGTQQRSMPQFQKGRELIREGRLGKIHKVHLTWNRNTDRVRKNALGVDPKSVDWKAFPGQRPWKQEWGRIPLQKLALVLGLRQRHPHGPDGSLH